MKSLLLAVAFLVVSSTPGCGTAPAATQAPAAAGVCVMSGEATDDYSPKADFMGTKVSFCCDKCVAKWNSLDDAGKKAKFDAMAKK
jgi:hypothetical protein